MRDASLSPAAGLNVLSGETGAGKSLLVQALTLLVGGRASADTVRAGADRAVVEGVFALGGSPEARRALADAGYDDGAELLIRRTVARRGRGGVWINGSPATVAVLRRVCAGLVDLTGQHASVALLKDDARLRALDAYADAQVARQEMADAWRARVEAQAALGKLRDAAADRDGRLAWLTHQAEGLESLAPRPGEFDELRRDVERLRHGLRLASGAGRAAEALYGVEGAARDRAEEAACEVEALAELDAALRPVAQDLRTASALLEDAAFVLRRYAVDAESSPAELQRNEERLKAYERALRQHGCVDDDELCGRLPAIEAELADLEDCEGRLEVLRGELADADARAREAAAALTRARQPAAHRLAGVVQEALRGLGMAKAVFRVDMDDAPLGPTGADAVEFVLGPNVGEEALPLQRVASGGELARTLLALKGALADADAVPVQVFDEVDAGVGGAAAEAVGRRLQALSERRQVLVITHQPQVAAYADAHFRLAKREADGRTETVVERLSDEGRAEELARMLGGADVSAQAMGLAEEMLTLAAPS